MIPPTKASRQRKQQNQKHVTTERTAGTENCKQKSKTLD